MRILGFPESEPQWRALARDLGAEAELISLHRFPDNESNLRLPPDLPAHIIIYRSLNDPNTKLVELILAATTARRLGVSHITLVAPYLCYMRQDREFQPGQAISQQIIGALLAAHFDAVITVDPHLHRIEKLEQAIPLEQVMTLSAAPLLGDYLAEHVECPLLLGPDEESLQWTREVAAQAHLDYAIATKTRHGDREVSIELPDFAFQNRNVVLVDDMISTGQTLAIAARALRAAGALTVHAAVTHALFNPGVEQMLQASGIERVWSTDSVPHPSNCIPLHSLLADAVLAIS